jgi:hypothetical protein
LPSVAQGTDHHIGANPAFAGHVSAGILQRRVGGVVDQGHADLFARRGDDFGTLVRPDCAKAGAGHCNNKKGFQDYKQSAGLPRQMEIYFPPNHDPATAKVPGVILFHGGGWSGGNLESVPHRLHYLASRGLVAATANYRMLSKAEANQLPAGETRKRVCITDAKSAIRWFKQHAAELGIDPQRIVTGGGSAGGHIAVLATTNPGLDDPADPQDIDTSVVAYLLFNPAFSPYHRSRRSRQCRRPQMRHGPRSLRGNHPRLPHRLEMRGHRRGAVKQRTGRMIATAQVDADNPAETAALIRKTGARLLINVALPYQDLALMDACLPPAAITWTPRTTSRRTWRSSSIRGSGPIRSASEKAGLSALLGSGFDPGVTNVFTAWALKHHFDEIHTLDIIDVNGGNHGKAFATNFNPEINIREVTAECRHFEDGGLRGNPADVAPPAVHLPGRRRHLRDLPDVSRGTRIARETHPDTRAPSSGCRSRPTT